MRIVKVFWGLDSALAYKRHFPAINWLTSYSLYADDLGAWFNKNVNPEWMKLRTRMMGILSDEASLDEIVKLVEEVLEKNPQVVYDHQHGKDHALGYLVGQVRKLSHGKANPAKAKEEIIKKIGVCTRPSK